MIFSPFTRSRPGLAENPGIQWNDYTGTIAFGAIIGAVLGLSFWFFHFRAAKRETSDPAEIEGKPVD